MSLYKVVCQEGELSGGRIKRVGLGTLFSSPSAAKRALAQYGGSEKLEVVPYRTSAPLTVP